MVKRLPQQFNMTSDFTDREQSKETERGVCVGGSSHMFEMAQRSDTVTVTIQQKSVMNQPDGSIAAAQSQKNRV